MKAKTDGGPTAPDSAKPDYIENIFQLMRLVSTTEVIAHYENAYNDCSIRYGDMKKQLAEDMVQFISLFVKKQRVSERMNHISRTSWRKVPKRQEKVLQKQ